jgi:hypothetical protein
MFKNGPKASRFLAKAESFRVSERVQHTEFGGAIHGGRYVRRNGLARIRLLRYLRALRAT